MVYRSVICLLLLTLSHHKCNSYRYQHYDYYDSHEEDSGEDHAPITQSQSQRSHHSQTSHNHNLPSSHSLHNHHIHRSTEEKKTNNHEPRAIDKSGTANSFLKPDERVRGLDVKPARPSETVNSEVQKVQEQERKRLETRTVDAVNRTENGSYKIVNYQGGVANRRGTRQADATPSDFVFPGPATRSSTPLKLIPEVPEECKQLGVCETVPNYPKEHVDKLLEQLGQEKLKLKVDETDIEIAQRFGPPDELKLCDDIEKVMIPQAAPDKTGKWYYIVNQKDTPLQGFHVSICRRDGSSCSSEVASYRPGYRATCKQKYVLRYLASIDTNGTLVQRHFKLPSCCTCVVEREF